MSLTALRSELRWERQKLSDRLAALEQAGLVKKHPSAGRELYLLAGRP
jgi:hypothetical protein